MNDLALLGQQVRQFGRDAVIGTQKDNAGSGKRLVWQSGPPCGHHAAAAAPAPPPSIIPPIALSQNGARPGGAQ